MLLVDNRQWLGPGGWRWIFFESAGSDFGPYMPLTWLSYRLGHAVHGLDARAFLLTNVLLHAFSAWALLAIGERLLPLCSERLRARPALARGAALAAALLWAVHPLRVEAVDWIAERRDVLCGAFLLASFWLWLRHVRGRRRAYWASVLLYAAALLSKSTPLAWPLVLLLLDAWPLRRSVTRRTLAEKIPLAVVAALVAAAAWAGQTDTGALADVSLPGRLVLGAHGAALLAIKSVLPVGLCAHYLRPIPFDAGDAAFLVPALLAVALTVVVFVRARRAPALAVAWCAALLLLAPVSGLVPIGSHAFADRYTYLAAIPLTLLVAGGGAAALAARPRAAATIAAVAVLLLGLFAAGLATTWRSTDALFERVLREDPQNWFAHYMLGALAEGRGDAAAARAHYRDWVCLTDAPDAHTHLGALQLAAGDDAAGLASARRALALDPGNAMAHQLVGVYLVRNGDPGGAERAWRRALTADPALVVAHVNLATLLSRTGRETEAAGHVRVALAAEPQDERARALASHLGIAR